MIKSIGIIMDGNRRWAKANGLSSLEGHKKGVDVLKRLSKETTRLRETYGLSYVTLYAFSTENWNRSMEEVSYLMGIFKAGFDELMENMGSDIIIRVIGERERFSPELQESFRQAEEKSKNNSGTTIVFALSYGGRSEILNTVNKLVKEGKEVTEEGFSKALWTQGIPDPDLIIRTGGAMRLSNFLPWQSVYSELFFSETYWPDFTVEEIERIFSEFDERERRHGK